MAKFKDSDPVLLSDFAGYQTIEPFCSRKRGTIDALVDYDTGKIEYIVRSNQDYNRVAIRFPTLAKALKYFNEDL